jgi:hypothetical protein
MELTPVLKVEKLHSHQNISLQQWCKFMMVNQIVKVMMEGAAEV